MDDFRRFFLRGLAALIPTLLTFAILLWAYNLVNNHVGRPITQGLLRLCTVLWDEPAPGFVNEEKDPLRYGTPIDEWDALGRRLTIEHQAIHHPALRNPALRPEAVKSRNRALWVIAFAKYHMHLVGFLIAIILVYFTGFFLASFIGRASLRTAEGLLARIPVIRAVYTSVKQVTDFLLAERRNVAYTGVVAVPYPRRGIWSLGLLTGDALDQIRSTSADDWVSVFIPSSPTPVTGYVIQVPRQDVIHLNMSIDEGLRFTVSGGVIKPGIEPSGLQADQDQSPSND